MPPFLKWIEGVINYFNHRQIKKFDACWIPDWPDSRLTGKLTQPTTLPVRFIGPLSRMSHDQKQVAPDYDVIALLSGPEPQRSVFEKILVDQLNRGGFRYKLVRGLPQQPEQNELPNSFNHLPGESLAELLNRAKVVVARSGYSTVMDLAALGTKAIFVPTPGQTEQEYLAQKLMAANMAYSEAQADFDLKRALERGAHYPGFESSRPDSNLLADALDSTIEKNEL